MSNVEYRLWKKKEKKKHFLDILEVEYVGTEFVYSQCVVSSFYAFGLSQKRVIFIIDPSQEDWIVFGNQLWIFLLTHVSIHLYIDLFGFTLCCCWFFLLPICRSLCLTYIIPFIARFLSLPISSVVFLFFLTFPSPPLIHMVWH